MEMLPEAFLNKQENMEIRDVLNFLHGYLSSFNKIELHLEETDGWKEGRKVNYKLNSKTILAIWVHKNEKKPFKCDVLDGDKKLSVEGLYEKDKQWENKSWRSLDFVINENELRKVRRLFKACIEINL